VEIDRRLSSWRLAQAKTEVRPCLKNKRAGGIALTLELLPSMLKALGSITSTTKK
jgi:hypothetical protein